MMDRKDFIEAIGAPDASFNMAMDRALLRISREERSHPVKRKLTLSLAAAILVLLMLAGAALAVGMNLFEHFGKEEERLSAIAPQTELENISSVSVSSDVLGETRTVLNNAYYDGKNLIVAFTQENSECYAPFEPTQAQLAQMEKVDEDISVANYDERMPGAEAGENFMIAMEAGTPCGFVQYSVYPSDHITVDDGVDLPPWYERSEVQADGSILYLREFERPLPEAAQDRDSLQLHIQLNRMVACYYFDGQDLYARYEHTRAIGEVSAVVKRTDAVVRSFTGTAICTGVPISVELDVSAVQATANISAEGNAFSVLEEDRWYDTILMDENGRQLRTEETCFRDDSACINYQGTGELPESLTLYIGTCGIGELYTETFLSSAVQIQLNPAA